MFAARVPLTGAGRLALRRITAVLAALALWHLAAHLLAGRYLLAAPAEVLAHLWTNADVLGRALAVTAANASAGFVLGNAFAIVLALVAVVLPRSERLLSTLALIGFCLPLVASGPILRVIFGPGSGPQITLAALAVYYTSYLALLVGLKAVPVDWLRLVRSYGRGRWSEVSQVRAPAALPYLVGALQIAAPAAFLGAMVGEFTGAERGMGVLVLQAMRSLDLAATWALALLAAAASMAAYAVIGAVGRRFVRSAPPLLLSPIPQTGPRRDAKALAGAIGAALVTLAVVLGLWVGGMELFDLNPFFAKRPGDVWAFLVTSPESSDNRDLLFTALLQTLVYAVPGYVAGLSLAVGLAVGLVLVPRLASVILPAAIALRSIPIIATAPLIVLALGRGATGMITIVAVMIFFPTLVACLGGLRQTPGQVIDIFDSYAASRWQRLAHAALPAMLPSFFAGARMAIPAALLAVTTAEWLATGTGIGALMALTASTSAYNMLWSATALLTACACGAYLGILAIERSVLGRYAAEQLAG